MLANEHYAVTHVNVDTAGQCLVSHSLTRRNGLVNISWASTHFCDIVLNLARFKTFCGQPAQKKDGHSNGDDKFYCCKGSAM